MNTYTYYKKIKRLRSITKASILACKNAIIKAKGRLNLAINFLINNSNNLIIINNNKNQNKNKNKKTKKSFIIICRRNQTQNKAVAILIATETDFITKNELFKKLANIILEVALFGKKKKDILKYKIMNKLPLFKIVNYFSNHIFNEYIELKQIVFIEAPFINFYMHHSWNKVALVGMGFSFSFSFSFSNYISIISKNLAIQLVCKTKDELSTQSGT